MVNEDPTEKLIRELKEENARLMEAMKKGGIVAVAPGDSDTAGMTEEGKELSSYFDQFQVNFISYFLWMAWSPERQKMKNLPFN